MTDVTTVTDEPPFDIKATPPTLRLGLLALLLLPPASGLDPNGPKRVVLVSKPHLNTPRVGLPGGTWDSVDDPVETLGRYLRERVNGEFAGQPRVLCVDYVPARRYPPGLNLIIGGTVTPEAHAELMRPAAPYTDLRFVPLNELHEAGVDEHDQGRIMHAARAFERGAGSAMTELGIPIRL